MTLANDDVALTVENGVATLSLMRAEQANALRYETAAALEQAVATINAADDVGAVVLRGGERVFSAGLDTSVLERVSQLPPADVARERDCFYTQLGALGRIFVPTIAVLEGPAVTGGVALAALCDLRIATPDAWLRVNCNELAFFTGLALPETLALRGSTGFATRILLTGERIAAVEAHRHGFYDWLVDSSEIDTKLGELLSRIVSSDRFTLMQIKRWLEHEVMGVDFRRTFWLEGTFQALSTTGPTLRDAVARIQQAHR